MKNEFYKNKYRILSTRLKNWDYSDEGMYFITICTLNRERFFGEIKRGKMVLNEYGKCADVIWQAIPEKYKNTNIDEYCIMPNHIHGIIEICCRDAIHRVSDIKKGGITNNDNPMLLRHSLATIIRWYKGRTSYEMHQKQKGLYFKWQPRYYDHIIRQEKTLDQIREYIHTNPVNWERDDYFK
ncbi:transposase [bacterium]|nr:transposase [bacterium]